MPHKREILLGALVFGFLAVFFAFGAGEATGAVLTVQVDDGDPFSDSFGFVTSINVPGIDCFPTSVSTLPMTGPSDCVEVLDGGAEVLLAVTAIARGDRERGWNFDTWVVVPSSSVMSGCDASSVFCKVRVDGNTAVTAQFFGNLPENFKGTFDARVPLGNALVKSFFPPYPNEGAEPLTLRIGADPSSAFRVVGRTQFAIPPGESLKEEVKVLFVPDERVLEEAVSGVDELLTNDPDFFKGRTFYFQDKLRLEEVESGVSRDWPFTAVGEHLGICSADGEACTIDQDCSGAGNACEIESPPQGPLLMIQLLGNGQGSVTTDGIDCPTGKCAIHFGGDTLVELVQNAEPGSVFKGFGGDCSNDGTVTMNADKVCTVKFDLESDASSNLDVDANGTADALTDGILALRFLFLFTGETLVSGNVVASDCVRCAAAEIEGFLQGLMLDVDGNGTADALTDGILILRYLFQFRGETLVAGDVVATDCTRCIAEEIEGFLGALQP